MAVKLFSNTVQRKIKEMRARAMVGLRSDLSAIKGGFMQTPAISALRDTNIDYDKARALYYNTDVSINNGAFFAKGIVDGAADHIGLPIISMKDENTDALVNGWIQNRWQKQIWELYRNALRDTKCWVRIRKPFPNPLLAQDEDQAVDLEIYEADQVTPYYNPVTKILERVEINVPVFIEDYPFEPANVGATGARVYGREHNISEIITENEYLYYDRTTGEFLENYTVPNIWGFVPVVEVFNDFDTALNGGSSELEAPFPFFQAFHDVIVQTRTAHGYHADPKVKFKLDDVMTFLRNNFPDSFVNDKFTGNVTWKGRDIYFMESTEDVGFIEATLNTANSVALLQFLIDCVVMASETPTSVLFRTDPRSAGETNELFRFKVKIGRKRNSFSEYMQQIIKMGLKVTVGTIIRTPQISWEPIQTSDLAADSQALNQYVTGAEIANRAGTISIRTYRAGLRHWFPQMKDDASEAADVKADQDAEQSRQLDYQKKLTAINPPKVSVNGGGPNGLARLGRVQLPVEAIHPQPGQ